MRKQLICLTAAVTLLANQLSAQTTRRDTYTFARLEYASKCILVPPAATANDIPTESGEVATIALALAGLLAGVAGDIASAGLSALAKAIDQASAEQGYNAEGTTNFPFYQVTVTGTDNPPVELSPAFINSAVEPRCLILAVDGQTKAPDPKGAILAALSDPKGPLMTLNEELKLAGKLSLGETEAVRMINLGLTGPPLLYIEAELQRRDDGFLVRPVLIWYREPINRAPRREALAAELDAIFATPAVPQTNRENDNDLGTVFAISRMKLPNIAPNQAIGYPTLKAFQGIVIPNRPISGSPTDTKNYVQGPFTTLADKKQRIAEFRTTQEKAQATVSAAGARATKAQRDALAAANEALAKTNNELTPLQTAATSMRTPRIRFAGTTNVRLRFTLVRDANLFGQAIAKSLEARAPAFGTQITTALTPSTPQQAWTASDTAYVSAQVSVAAAQRTVDTATAGGDAAALALANDTLRNAKATANEKAAAAGRPLPYPGLN